MKRLIVNLAVIAVIHHILTTLLYLSPPNLLKQNFEEHIFGYMNPLFSQNWHLFSPNPGISFTRLAVRCGSGEWIDPQADIQKSHAITRILGYGKIMSIYEDSFHKVKKTYTETLKESQKNAGNKDAFIQSLRMNSEVKKIINFSEKFCAKINPEVSNNMSVKLLEFFPKKYSARSSDLPWSRVIEYQL